MLPMEQETIEMLISGLVISFAIIITLCIVMDLWFKNKNTNLEDELIKQGNLPLVIRVTNDGRVSELHGDIWGLAVSCLGAGEQFHINILADFNGYNFKVYHYNYTPNPKYRNTFVGNELLEIYGDVLLIKYKDKVQLSITIDDIKWLFERKLLSPELKSHLEKMVEL